MDSRNRRTVGILALLALLAGGGAWIVNASKSARHEHAGPVAIEPRTDPAATALDARGSEAKAREHIDPSSSRPASTDDGHASTVEILVVLRGTGTPVVGADVRCASPKESAAPYDPRHPLAHPDLEVLLASVPAMKSDANGIARVPANKLPGFVCARLGDLYGGWSVDSLEAVPIRIEVDRDTTFLVRVVDAGGVPRAGVPVSLQITQPGRAAQDAFTQTTGDQGLARIAHLQQQLAWAKGVKSLGVHLALVGFDAPLVPIDVEHLPADPVRLVLPATGALTLVVHDSDQRPVTPDGVNLVEKSKLGADGNVPMQARTFDPEVIESGRVHYAFVPLDLELAVEVYGSGGAKSAAGVGPRSPGEEVVFDVDMGPPVPEIVGRLVDEKAEPIAECDVQVETNLYSPGGFGGLSYRPLRTDARGVFRFALSVRYVPDLGGTLTFRPFGTGRSQGEEGRVQVDGKIREGRTELGDVVVHSAVMIASGTIVDDLGAPVPKALIGGEVLVIERGVEMWKSDSTLGGKCDAAGSFTVKGSPRDNTFRLFAQPDDYVPGTSERLRCGASGVSIVLTRASRIRGNVLLDDATALPITARVRTKGGKSDDLRLQVRGRKRVSEDGTFDLAGLEPGRVDLELRVEGRGEPLRVIDGILLSPGETSDDARLGSIDLRGLMPAKDPAGPR